MAKSGEKRKGLIEAKQARKIQTEPAHKKCFECGGRMEGRYTNYPYTECGLDNVVLKEVLVYNCECGAIVPEIVAISALHRFIAMALLKKPAILDGKEVRFLRKFVNYSATELADVIGSTKVTMSRWENGAPITKNSDRLLRLAFFTAILGRDLKEVLGRTEEELPVAAIVAFARTVESFDLPSFLRTIEDQQKRCLIRVDPSRLLGLGAAEIDISEQPVLTGIQ